MRFFLLRVLFCTFTVACFETIATAQLKIAPEKAVRLKDPMEIRPIYSLKQIEEGRRMSSLPGFYKVNPQGFFCRAEFRLEQRTGIPFRFRLGSLEYTNALENK